MQPDADRPKLRKKDLTPATRKVERRLRAKFRRLWPDLDLEPVFDQLRPMIAEAARDGRPDTVIERQLARVAIRTLPGYIAQAMREVGNGENSGGGSDRE